MFNAVISDTHLHKIVANAITSKGNLIYPNIGREEAYLRDIYPVVEFDPQEYIDNTEGKFVVKTAGIGGNNYEQLIHEVYLTLNMTDGISHLQKVRDVKFTDIQVCVIFEYIEGETIFDLVSKYYTGLVTLNDIIKAIDNTIEQLGYLYETYQFTHYDLHGSNIIVHKKDIVILDLEMSYAVINGESYGVTLRPEDDECNLITPAPYWPFDLFKLIGSIKRQILTTESASEEFMKDIRIQIDEDYKLALSEDRIDDADRIIDNLRQLEMEHKVRITMIKNKLHNDKLGKYIDVLLAYFISPHDFKDHMNRSPYLGAPRLDLMYDNSKYLTTFDNFYQYSSNINDLFSE